MGMHESVKLVKSAYEDLINDDYDAFLRKCAPEAEVEYPAEGQIRYGGLWRGREGISRFFKTHDEEEEILEFRIDEYVGQADRVVVLGEFQGRAKSSGRTWGTRFVHILTVRDRMIQRFEACYDTAAAVEAHRQT